MIGKTDMLTDRTPTARSGAIRGGRANALPISNSPGLAKAKVNATAVASASCSAYRSAASRLFAATIIYLTIFVAILLAVAVVFLFLQNWRATIIPVIAIPVTLVLRSLLVFGISLNNLSLFGLVLAVGIVVTSRFCDDGKQKATRRAERGIRLRSDPGPASDGLSVQPAGGVRNLYFKADYIIDC